MRCEMRQSAEPARSMTCASLAAAAVKAVLSAFACLGGQVAKIA